MLRQLGDELYALAALALQIAGGDLEARFNPARPEIGVFGAMEEHMVATLKGKIAEADEKSQQARKNLPAPKRPLPRQMKPAVRPSTPRPRYVRAAHQLEGVVEIAVLLRQKNSRPRLSNRSRGADEQSARVRETATAMEER